MDKIKNIIKIFLYVVAGMTISTAIFISIFNSDLNMSVSILWQIIIISAVCSLGNFIYHNHSDLSKNEMKIRLICHFLYINVVVIGGGFLFGWLSLSDLPEVIVMFIMIAVVYTVIMVTDFHQDEKMAEMFNHQLRKRYPDSKD